MSKPDNLAHDSAERPAGKKASTTKRVRKRLADTAPSGGAVRAKKAAKSAKVGKKKASAKSPATPPVKGRRAEKSEQTRKRLLEATVRLVGVQGHAGATIRNITSNANIAHGTFYNYFESQQDIFDQILPYLGEKLLRYLDERFDDECNFTSHQGLFLVAFADFMRETPGFYRIMTEAEVFAPTSYRVYLANVIDWFVQRFSEGTGNSAAGDLTRQQLEIVALMVLASNEYINMRVGDWMGDVTRMPSWVIDTFHKFIQGGIAGVGLADGSAPNGEHAASFPVTPHDRTPHDRSSDDRTSENRTSDDRTRMPGDPSMARATPGSSDSEAVEIAAHSLVKLTPHRALDDAALDYSAQSIQIECRLRYVSTTKAILELDIDRRALNSRGAVSGGTLAALAEIAADAILAGNRAAQISGETIALNCTMIRPAMEGVLVAQATMENAGRNIRFVSVRITLDAVDGPLIATSTATMRVIE